MNIRKLFARQETPTHDQSEDAPGTTPPARQSEPNSDTASGSRGSTSYDVTIDGQTFRRLAKKHAIFRVVKRLCKMGIHPDRISGFPKRSPSQTWCCVEGTLDGPAFREQARQQLSEAGKPTDNYRWFWADDELIYADGKTYAFSAKWGPTTEEAMAMLLDRFPNAAISYRPTE